MMSSLTSKRGYNLPKGTKVLMPIAGFPTTLNPTLQVGFVPVFVDIEVDTLNLNVDEVERVLEENPDIRVITFAHVLGNSPDMNRLMELVSKYDLLLLEDCCDALGSTYDGKPLGSHGIMSSCSFYPAHHMTMGEGGAVFMNNPELKIIAESFRDWGRDCYCPPGCDNTCGCRFEQKHGDFPVLILKIKASHAVGGRPKRGQNKKLAIVLCSLQGENEPCGRQKTEKEPKSKLASVLCCF
jgi:CDP-6-deoxy-D-xylo-4-hexulose-3-dehydrase